MARRITVKYRIGLVFAIMLSLGLFVGMFYQGRVMRQDQQTQNTANDIEDRLSSYINDKQLVPDSLAAAGIRKVPPGIIYTKLNGDAYRFCVTYKSPYISPYHKGRNCQDFSAYLNPPVQQPFIKNSDGSYTVCGIKTSYFVAEGNIVPPTINTPNAVDVSNQIFVFSAGSKAFDEKCNALAQADLGVGDKVDVFDIVAAPNVPSPAVSIFLKRS